MPRFTERPVKKGLVERRRENDDRRIVCVSLAEKGTENAEET